MKKTLIALFALAGLASGATLSLTTPANGELSSGNSGFFWTEDDVASTEGDTLTSWELSFTLTDTNALANDTFLFGTERNNSGAAGFILKEHADGSIQLTTKDISAPNDYNVSLAAGTVSQNTGVTITLSYVATENLDGDIIGGTFTLSSGSESVTLEVDTADYNNNTAFECSQNNGTRLWTNGGNEKFTNITLSKLDNQVVPEPATASLSLLGLAALMIRRRR